MLTATRVGRHRARRDPAGHPPSTHFLWDIYHDQKILADGILPRALVVGNSNFRPEMMGLDVPLGVYVHVNGTDIVRDGEGRFLVLEDNARTPSGVSYVIENRHMTLRVLPDLASGFRLRGVEDYGVRLRQALVDASPAGVLDPQVVLLSPGIYNSAYFEHVFLAREMGVPAGRGPRPDRREPPGSTCAPSPGCGRCTRSTAA